MLNSTAGRVDLIQSEWTVTVLLGHPHFPLRNLVHHGKALRIMLVLGPLATLPLSIEYILPQSTAIIKFRAYICVGPLLCFTSN